MSLQGSIAVSLAGRDKDRIFIIVGVLDEKYVFIWNDDECILHPIIYIYK